MERPQHILVIIDPNASEQPALARARDLALAFQARVELFICYTPRDGGARADEIELERLANGLRELGIETNTDEASDANLHTGIVRKVLRSKPSLVVKETHPHTLLRRSVLANTDWQLIRLCPAPLLLVRPGHWGKPPRIAAAVDVARPGEKPAALDHALLAAAETFALASEGQLHAVHAYTPVTELAARTTVQVVSMASGVDPAQVIADSEKATRAEFDDLLVSHPIPKSCRHLVQGAPSDALVGFVRRNHIDLLVMGAYARGWMYNVLVGSTTERVLDLLPCDVLVMKPASFECPLQLEATMPEHRAASTERRSA